MKPTTMARQEVRAGLLRSLHRAGGWASGLALALMLPWAVAAPADPAGPTGGRAGPPVHVLEAGRYTVRANAVPTGLLPASTTGRHEIAQAPDRAILNIVVLERQPDGNEVTVPARVQVRKENLLGGSETVAMREVKENDRVSYLGEFEFQPLQNFRFVLRVQPAGSDQVLETAFEDRFVARKR